jgi:hypothetical protein
MTGRARLGLFAALALAALPVPACRPSGGSAIAPAEPTPIPGRVVERFVERIHALFPPNAYAGVPFSVRFDGSSVLGVSGEGFSPASTVYFGDVPLTTDFGSRDSLTATVPADLVDRPGSFAISVRDPAGGRSPDIPFTVLPPRIKGACPEIRDLYPPSVPAGKSFARRPDGASVLGVAGTNFGPSSKVVFEDRELRTTYQGPGSLVAVLPAEAIRRKGRARVTVTDPECPRPGAAAWFEIR